MLEESASAPASLKQSNRRREEQGRTVIKEEVNIKQEQSSDDYGIHAFGTTFVGVKVEPEFSKAKKKDLEVIKQEPYSQLEENRVWNTECAEVASDFAECKIVNTTSDIVPKCEEDASDDNPNIECKVCGRLFSCSNRLITHRRMHFRVIKCDTCGKSYKILRSAKLSTGEEVHVCKASDEYHMQKYNLNGDKESNLKTLQEHISSNKPHKCEFCGKSYKREYDLKLHIFAHSRK